MRRARGIDLGPAIIVAAGVALGSMAQAAPPSSLRVGAEEGACPTSMQVATVLKRLLRRTEVTADAGPLGPDDAAIVDQGSQFRVTVAGQERSFADPSRACAERAQNAAVFVALVLDPPMIAEPAPPEPVVRAPVAQAPPAAERPAPRAEKAAQPAPWDLSLGGVVLVAPAVRGRSTAVIGGAQAWVRGNRGFHIAFGAGLLRGSLDFASASANGWWIPLDIAAGFTGRAGFSELGVEIGPSANILSIIGEDLQQAKQQIRVEIGARASTWVRFWLDKKFALYVSADALYRPVPYTLLVDPEGQVGHTPGFWLGASAGLSAALE